jgi:hypothetical protein
MINPTMPIFGRNDFRKAARSGQNPQACVEVARRAGWVVIRDSKQLWNSTDDHRLVFSAEQFDACLDALSAGSTDTPCIEIARHGVGVNVFRSTVPQEHDNALTFTDGEIEAFLDGVRNGEFAKSAFTGLASV